MGNNVCRTIDELAINNLLFILLHEIRQKKDKVLYREKSCVRELSRSVQFAITHSWPIRRTRSRANILGSKRKNIATRISRVMKYRFVTNVTRLFRLPFRCSIQTVLLYVRRNVSYRIVHLGIHGSHHGG